MVVFWNLPVHLPYLRMGLGEEVGNNELDVEATLDVRVWRHRWDEIEMTCKNEVSLTGTNAESRKPADYLRHLGPLQEWSAVPRLHRRASPHGFAGVTPAPISAPV